jgi:hypothetical protein
MEISTITPINDNQGKPYQKPLIVVEFDLETRAGSPLGLPDEWPELEP